MKNLAKAMLLMIISWIYIWNVSAATIDKIEALNNSSVELTANPEIIFSDVEVNWEVKILRDIPVSFSVKDAENLKKVLINLSSDLKSNTSYSLISILWANWNIDFTIWDFLQWEIENTNLLIWEEWIEKVDIVDSRTMELYFSNDLTEDLFEFKILSEIKTNWLTSEWNNKIQLEVTSALENSTNYIIMILSLDDVNWDSITFNEDLLDFTTPSNLTQAIPEEENGVATVFTEPVVEEEWNVEEVALNSAGTPETGAATSIMILLAVIVNSLFFFRKKIFK